MKGTKRTRHMLVVLICALAGAAIFLSLYGSHVLRPAYTDWLMDGGSLSRSYLGWHLFQDAGWQFPPSAIASLGYPQPASVAATDSVPLVAMVCKLLSPLYEGPFQYFGLWGLLCFVLQGVFGGLLCLRITRSFWQALLGGLLFILSPVLWQNTFSSAGMAGHWIVLAALLALFCRQTLSAQSRLPSVVWGLLGLVSVGVHGQLVLICGIFCLGYCVYAVLDSGRWEKFMPFAVFLLVALVAGWMFGSFSENGMGTLHFFGISPFALWDPHNYSRVLYNVTNPGDYQYAGFAFVGFGMLVLCALAVVWLGSSLFSRGSIGEALRQDIRTHRADVAAFGFVLLACVAFGLAQPTVYLLMALAISVLARKMSRQLLSFALVCCLCLQAYDLSTVFQVRKMHYDRVVSSKQGTVGEDWAALAKSGTWSTVVISPSFLESVYLAPLVQAVAQNGQTLNTLSYASDFSYRNWEKAIESPKEDMVFLFTAEELKNDEHFQRVFASIDYLYQRDQLIVGFVKPTLLPFPQIVSAEDISFQYRYAIGTNEHLRNGEDIGGIRYIYPGGLSYGPYVALEPGQYEVRVTGEHLDEADFSFTMGEGEMKPTQTLSLPSERVYRLDVTQAVSNLEILIGNSASDILFFDAMTIAQLD